MAQMAGLGVLGRTEGGRVEQSPQCQSTLPCCWDQPVTGPSQRATWTFHFFAGGAAVSRAPERFSGPVSQSAQAPVTKVPQAGGLDRRLYFSQLWRLKRGRILSLVGASFLVLRGHLLPVTSRGRRGSRGSLLSKGPDPIPRAPPHDRVTPAPLQWG